MAPSSLALKISTALLWGNGVQGLLGLPSAFIAPNHGDFNRVIQVSNILGTVGAALIWFGLAYFQWRSRGGWGRGIGIFAFIVVGLQSWLTYLAVSRGRVEADALLVVKFVTLTVMIGVALGISSLLAYSHRPNQGR